MKKFPKILKLVFVLIFLFQMIGLAILFAWPEITQATTTIELKPQVTIPSAPGDSFKFNAGEKIKIDGNSIGNYIKLIYKYAIGIVGILAAIVMMIGGFMWLMAAGNPSKISEAQEWIRAALTGLVLALGSYMILATINPALTTFKSLDIKQVTPTKDSISSAITTGCCEAANSCSATTKESCGATFKESYACNGANGKCEASSATVPLSYKECFSNTDCNQGFYCAGGNKQSGVKGKCEKKIVNSPVCTPEINQICNVNGTVCIISNGKATCPEPKIPLSTFYKK